MRLCETFTKRVDAAQGLAAKERELLKQKSFALSSKTLGVFRKKIEGLKSLHENEESSKAIGNWLFQFREMLHEDDFLSQCSSVEDCVVLLKVSFSTDKAAPVERNFH